jgi:DNA-binding NarL/FixJ family response regulator
MKVLVVDEHPLLREALEATLRRQFPQAQVVSVESHEAAREALLRQPVDVVLADLFCCRDAKLKTLPDVVSATAPGRVVVLGKCDDRQGVRRAQAAGACGYIPATAPPELIGAAVALVRAGGLYFPQLGAFDHRSPSDDPRPLLERMSPRHREVLQGLRAGQSNKAIARSLGISVATVKLHVQAIFRITGAHNRTEAVVLTAADQDTPSA